MILQALTRYYEDLLAQGKIDAPGWAPVKISFALYLDENGGLTQVVPTMEDVTKGKKTVQQPQSMALPAAVKRTVGIAANFLWDNSSYLLGIDQKGRPERSRNCFAAAAKLHHAVLDGVDSPVAHSILAFFDNWKPENAAEHPALAGQLDEVISGGNLLFRAAGIYPQEDAAIREAWQRYRESGGTDAVRMQCLVTGREDEITAVHPSVKGVRDAQSSGAALVSFNAPAFCSYGHEQSFNAPVGKYAAFAYTAALNHLLADKENVQTIGDTTVVCWAERHITWGRAAIIKAYYLKNPHEDCPKEVLTVSLNEASTNTAYTLGRLFSVYEAVQQTANPGINATIKDKYFNSASAMPASIFPVLNNLYQKHLRKLEGGQRVYYDKQVMALKGILGESYPARMTLAQQGAFDLGYYHQTQKRFTKKEEENNV